VHGCIAGPGCIQVPIEANLASELVKVNGRPSYLDHFKELWTRAMLGFLRNAVHGDVLIFAPELLASTHYYARLLPDPSGKLVEESDRYAQALIYKDLARTCLLRRSSASQPDPRPNSAPTSLYETRHLGRVSSGWIQEMPVLNGVIQKRMWVQHKFLCDARVKIFVTLGRVFQRDYCGVHDLRDR
jgi:hypothetical protein